MAQQDRSKGKQSSEDGSREDRENPTKSRQQSGTKQSHEGTRARSDERDSRAMSQNGAAIRDFEDRPSR